MRAVKVSSASPKMRALLIPLIACGIWGGILDGATWHGWFGPLLYSLYFVLTAIALTDMWRRTREARSRPRSTDN